MMITSSLRAKATIARLENLPWRHPLVFLFVGGFVIARSQIAIDSIFGTIGM
jgi:hypothetical protein